MGMAVDGLISGLNTTQLIDSLMQAEAIPQTLLKNKVTDSTTYITAMQALNTKVAALADSATKLAKPAGVDLHTASTSSTAVTATAGPGAVDGTIDFTVDTLAQSQVMVTGPADAVAGPTADAHVRRRRRDREAGHRGQLVARRRRRRDQPGGRRRQRHPRRRRARPGDRSAALPPAAQLRQDRRRRCLHGLPRHARGRDGRHGHQSARRPGRRSGAGGAGCSADPLGRHRRRADRHQRRPTRSPTCCRASRSR